jgi:hypothetical protein
VEGLLLGFAAFDEHAIRRGIVTLAAALEQSAPRTKARTAAPSAGLATFARPGVREGIRLQTPGEPGSGRR